MDHQIDNAKLAFAYLRPACVLLTREPTVGNVERLSTQLRHVNDGTLQQLQDYVLFPLRFVLKIPGPKQDGLVQALTEAMAYILENTCVQCWQTLRDLLSELCLCLCSPTDPGKPAPASEELKTAVLRCLDALLHAAYGDVVFKLFEPTMLPGLGAAISLLLALGEQEKSRTVQAAALKCLQALTLQCDCSLDHVSVGQFARRTLGSTMASFLPGITIAVSRVITGDMRHGHAVTVRAIKVWFKTVALVMADDQLQDAGGEEKPPSELGRVGELVVQRTPDWVRNTAGRLALLLKNIISCTSAHQHWRVRLEMVNLSHHLLANCKSSLGECVGLLLEALVGAVNDTETTVRVRCEAALMEVGRRCQNSDGNNLAFTDVLSENLHSLATSLPRLMRTSDDQRKMFVLNVFLGYLKILGPQVISVLNSAAHLQRVTKALMQVLELDVTDVRIVEERSSILTEETEVGHHRAHALRKHFLYFTDERIFAVVKEICRMLGYYGNVYLLVDHLMDVFKESSVYRKQAAMVLNEVITGAAGIGVTGCQKRQAVPSQEDLKLAVESIIEEYTSLSHWHLSTRISEESESGEQEQLSQSSLLSISNGFEGKGNPFQAVRKSSTIHELNSNIWQICVQLEGMGCFAHALGMDFRLILMTSLYPVLEKAGDETLLISQAALNAMWDISQACGYASLKELINENADYLLNNVSLNLQRLGVNPQAPRVLTTMFSHSDSSLLPLVGDIVQDVLLALDMSYDETSPLFCTVLHSLMKALARWFPSGVRITNKNTGSKKVCEQDQLNLQQFILDYHRQKELAEGIGAEEDMGTENPEIPPMMDPDEDMAGLDVKAELPAHVAIAKEVMERCVHLLSDPRLRLRLKVLEVLELCVCVLSEQENELLPMAHRCWPALLLRLTADDPLAVLQAFKVLCTLGETSRDFLRNRVSKEVLPKLTASLSKQAPVSARTSPVYSHTLAYKLQLAVLQGLGSLCLRLDLGDMDLDAVTEACLPYLSCRQPPQLQEACLSVFRHLIEMDPDAFWFTLNELYCPTSYSPPHPDLQRVELSGMGLQRNEYTDNVLKLLEDFSLPQDTSSTDGPSPNCPSQAETGTLN